MKFCGLFFVLSEDRKTMGQGIWDLWDGWDKAPVFFSEVFKGIVLWDTQKNEKRSHMKTGHNQVAAHILY